MTRRGRRPSEPQWMMRCKRGLVQIPTGLWSIPPPQHYHRHLRGPPSPFALRPRWRARLQRLYWACPFIPHIWGRMGPVGGWVARIGFEASYSINMWTRLLTLPLRPHLPDFYILGFPVRPYVRVCGRVRATRRRDDAVCSSGAKWLCAPCRV